MNKTSDLDFFEILVKQNYDKVYRAVYAYTKDRFVSEDAVQQAFIIVFRKINELKDKDKLASWATIIAINESKHILKKRANENVVYLPDMELGFSGNFNEDQLDSKSDIKNLLKNLKKPETEILILKYYADLTLQQISEVLGINLSNTKVRLHRARESFRKLLEKDNQSLGGGL